MELNWVNMVVLLVYAWLIWDTNTKVRKVLRTLNAIQQAPAAPELEIDEDEDS